jgi:CO dehydrogenase/acetyl-CoA synthase beta subunit
MKDKVILKDLHNFFIKERNLGKKLTIFQSNSDKPNYFKKFNINIELENNKGIILQEETSLELGGVNRNSFSMIYTVNDLDLIKNGRITLLGPEVNEIQESSIDFGIFILIMVGEDQNKVIDELKHLSFISNSIEGFMIRTIPRRFWCRISSQLFEKNFSFEFLGNAIIHLYNQKFGALIRSIEIFIINSYPNSIKEFIELSSEITKKSNESWKLKVEEWKKRLECDYDWACEICPYSEECYDIKQLLNKRKEI